MTGGQEEKCIENEKTNRESLVRPKTRLVRPTPNIKHPVITSADCKKKNSATGTLEKGPGANNAQSKSVTANDSTDNNKSEDQVRCSGAKKCNVKGASDAAASAKDAFSSCSKCTSTSSTSAAAAAASSSSSCSHKSHGRNGKEKKEKRQRERQRERQRNASKHQEPQQVGATSSGQREGVKKNGQFTSSSTSSGDICHSRTWERFKSSLKTCTKCQRQFFAYRITHHLQLCSGQMDATKCSRKETSKAQEDAATKAIGQSSPLPLPKSSSPSQSSPSPGVEVSLQKMQLDMSEEEMAQWQEHLKKLKKCKICTRSFFPERLGTHQAICAQKTLDQSHPCRRQGKKELSA